MAEAFPLSWPAGYPRTEDWKRRRSNFKHLSFAQARGELFAEIRRLGARNPVLSSNVPLRQDGLPYANKGILKDPGVAVYFTLKNQPLVIACDRWTHIEDNLHAIQLTIDSMRGMERWGCSDMLNRAFTGFTALPAPELTKHWSAELGMPKDAPLDSIESRYRTLMKEAHPDTGGSTERAARLNRAIEEARRERRA